MGNEASLEGGEGLPEGLAPDGKGGFVRVSDGTPVDLSKLSEEQRQQLSAAMARAQGKHPPGAAARRPSQGDVQQRSQLIGGSRGSGGLSKSRTVDAFNQGPVGKPSPGRSPSSLSLFESRFRQEPKTSESKSSGMFGSSFLSGANPLSAMTSSLSSMGDSVNIPKFGIFGDEEEGDASAKGPQQQGPKGPQQGGLQKPGQGPAGQGPKPGQGPPGQGPKPGQGLPGQGPKPGQGPPGQGPKPGQGPPGQGPKPGQGPPGQGPKPGQGPPGQGPKPGQGPQGQGPKPGQGPQGQGPKPGQVPQGQGSKQGQGPQGQGPNPGQGPPGPGTKPTGPPQQGAGPKQQGPVGTGSQPSKSAGPGTQQGAGKAVPCPLCKTTQMNIGSKDPPNYNNCTECKSQVCSLCGFSPPDSAGKEWLCLNCQMQRAMGGMDPPNPRQGSVPPSPQKQAPGKPGNLLIKQQSHQSDQGLTPPTTPRQKSPGPTSSGPPSPGSSMAGSPKIDPKTGKPIMQKSSPQQSPSKAKQESSFFGGFGLGGLTDSVKSSSTSSQSESVTGKLFGGFGGLMETSKPPAQTAPKQEESVAGKLFSGFGGLSDSSSKPPAAASQMFSFGSSLLSSATNLVTGDDSTPAEPSGSPPQSPDSGPGSPPDSPFSAPGSPPDSDSAPDTPPARFTKPTKSMSIDAEKKPALTAPTQSCPLCNVELSMGSSDTPNYSLCTECKKTVCNLCGFNPMPHLGEKEWLCLNCQTQRAMAGQLGDEPPPVMGSPKKQPPPAPVAPTSTSTSTSTTPTPTPASVETKPVVEPSALNPDVKVEDPNIPLHDNSASPPDDSPHQTKEYITGNTPELPALVQTQSSLDREEGGPKPETNTEPCVPVTVVAPHQEDKNTLIQPPSEESETLNLSTKTEIDNTTALLETQPNPEISQSEAPADKQEDASPTADTLLEETTNSGETKIVTDPVVVPENCETGADVLLKEQGEPNVEDAQSKPVDQSLTETIGDNAVGTESVQAEITEKESDIKTDTRHASVDQPVSEVAVFMDTEPGWNAITNEVEQCVENKEVISTTEQLHTTESTTEKAITEVKPVEENSVEVTPADNSTAEGEVVQQEIITAKDRAIANPESTNVVEQCIENKEIVSTTEQLHTESTTDETITEVKPMEENIVEVTPVDNSTTEGDVGQQKVISVKDRAIESPEITNEVEQCIENKEIVSTTEQLPIKSPTEELITEVKPVEENIMGLTTANESTAEDAMIKVKDSAIESPEVVDKSQPYDAKAQEEEVAERSTEVKADEGEENRQEDLGQSVGEEESTNISLIPSAEDSNKSVAQASTHFEEHAGISEKTGSSYLIEQNDTNAPEPLPSEDNIQVSSVASKDVTCETSLEQPSQSIANVPAESQQDDNYDVSVLTRVNEKPVEEVAEQKVSVTEKEKKNCTNVVESQPVAENLEISISDPDSAGVVKDATPERKIELSIPSHNEQTQTVFQLDSTPLEKADIPESVVCSSLDKSDQVEITEEPLVKPVKEDAEVKTTEQAPTEKAPETTGSPTGLSDLTKLENTVLPILEAKPKPEEDTLVDTPKTRRKLEVLPIMPDSPSSEEERETLEQNVKEKKKLLVPMDIRGDSLEDSSESIGKESPMSGDDEDFIRKQIIEMSENEDASPTDEENVIRQKIKEQEKTTASVEKSASGRGRRLTKKATISPDEDEDKHLEEAAAEVVQEGKESKPDDSGPAVRQFQTMELNAPSMKIATSEGEVEMECLTDSPDDRSKGEGSSSLHASSFTPGTSPTSMSSFDEDSDSSSPSNMSTGEGKQQRKAKHRQPGQLPTIEDSSEEEELREEEELLREQEKQKSSGKKSKRDKEDKSQRRRERSKTPPSNLSPIEDASPTEELRQEAEMEEMRRSSCSDFSPSLESDPEGFEIHASKIAAFQKSYKLPVSSDSLSEDKTKKKPLKTADETYEEIMLRAKSPTTEKVDNQPEKEALYGGMLIEDYAYTSLIDNSTNEKEEPERMALPTQPKKLRSPDEVYEDMLKKRKEFQKLEEEYQKMQPKQEPGPTPEIVLQPAENINNPPTITTDTDGKPLLDADTAYEELMRKVLTPTSPSQQDQDVETTPAKRALYPIPDLKVTQCSSGELSSDEEFYKKEEEPETPEPPPVSESSKVSPSEPSDIIVTTSQAAVDLSGLSKATPLMCSVTPLPTVPQYTPGIQSVVTTAPPVPPKPYIMRRANSQDSADMAVAPPPTTAKPTVFPRKAPVPLPHQASTTPVKPEDPISMTAVHGSPIRHPTCIPTYRAHVPPPVPPKPCIPCGMSEGPRAAHGVKPPIAPKPASQPTSPAHVPHPPRPTMLPTGSAEIALNLSPTSEHKQFQSSPKSPPSPRYASNLRDTYVVITLPSQPSSPVEPIMTQAPFSPAPASPSQAPPHSYTQPQAHQQTYPPQQVPPQPQRVPLAYTRVTESIENQEICSPEKHVSSSCRIIEAISASAQPPVVTPNLISQVVTTEVQRTTVSVVHERTPPPVPAPRANGVPLDKTKQQNPPPTTQAVQPCEVVDLRTMKVDQQSTMNGVDLSAGPDPRRQSYVTDASRQNSAVQSPVVNLSAESSTVSIVTDSITIVTCAATIQRWDNADATTTSSVPLKLTKNKSFEPLSQIVYRPVDAQTLVQAGAEIPINLSVGSGAGTYQSGPITTAPPCAFAANGLTTGTATVAGAVDLSTTKPFNTLVLMDGASSEAVTAVITDDDGKPVDLTGGKRAVCCDVVYNLPFAGSCTRQQPTTPLPEDRFGYRDDHYQYDRTPYGMRGFGGIKPSMSDTNLAEAGLFFYKSKNSYNFNGTTDGAVDLTSAKISDAGEAVDYSKKGMYAGMAIPPFSDARVTSAVGTVLGTTNVLRSSNGIVYSSVGSPNPSTYAITTQPGSIFSTTYNNQSGMHTSDTMPSLSNLQNIPLTRSHSFISTISAKEAEVPLNLELCRTGTTGMDSITPASLTLDTYTDASLEAIAASLEALSSPMVAGDGQYLAERERLEMEKLKQQCLADELEKERQEIQRFREHEQVLVQKELEELQAMKQQILDQQEEERQAHLLMQKETYAQQQQQLEQIQRLQEQLRLQLEEQKLRQLFPGVQEAVVLGPDGTVLARKITDSGCQTDEEDETISNAYTAGRKKKNAKKSVDSCVQTDDEDQEDWEENRNRRPRTARGDRSAQSEQSKPSTPTGTQKKVKRTLPNPPSEEESTTATATTTTGQTAYSTNSARRRMCRNSNMARAKILQDIDRELDMVERESSKLRKRQAELDEEEKEIDAKLRYLEMGINRRKDALLKERDKRERAYLQSVADDRDYMSDSEVSHIRETRSVIGAVEDEDIEVHGLERPRTAPQSELDDFGSSQTKGEYDKYSQYPYSQSQYQSLYQTPQSYQSPSIYSSVPSLTSSQQQSYHQMLLLQQKAARQAALLSELDATKYDVISRQPDPTSSAYLGVKYDKYGNHLDLRALDVGSIANAPMSAVSDSYYSDVDHHTPRSYMLLEDAAEIAKGSTGLSSSYSLAERELAKAEKLLRRSAADLGSTDYLGSTSRLHTYGKTPDEEDTMEEPYELKLLKQQLKQEFRRSTGGTESLEQLSGQHYYTPTTGLSSYSQRQYPKTDKYSISRLTLEKQAAKQLPAPMLYQKHKTPVIEPKVSSKYSSVGDRGLESEYTSYIGSSGSPRTSRLMQDEITFGLRKNIAEQQKYLGSNLGANLAGSLNLGQSLGLDSAYPSGSRSRPPSRPTSCYGLDLSIKRDPSSSSLRLKGDGESGDGSSYQTPSGRTKPTSLPIVQSGRGRIPIVAQNSEEESPLSPVGQPMGMARASAGPLPPISADSRDQFGSCLSLQDPQQQQQYIREEPTRGRGSVLLDDLQGTMSDSEALNEHPMTASSGDATHAYHLRHEETDWFEKPRDGRADGLNKKQGKGPYYPFPHLRVKLQRDPKDRTVSGNGLGIRIVGGKEVPNSNGDIGAYVAKVLPGGAAEQTGKILEGMQVLEWNGLFLTGKTYEEVQGLVGQPCNEAEMCVRLDLNMLAESEMSQNLDFQEHSKSERPPRSPGVDPMQLAAELQKVSQQQAPLLPTSSTSSPAQPGSPSISKKRHGSKTAEGAKIHSHPISGEIQLQIHYDKQLGNLIVHVLQARNLAPRDNNGYSDPFVKVYLLPGRGQVMVVQNASAENKRKSKHAGRSINPEWNQTVIYKNIHLEQLKKKTLEVSVWDYDKCSSNDFLGEVLIDLSNTSQLDNAPRWVPLKEQSEGDHHRRSHSGQSRHSSKTSSQHSSPKTGSTHDIHDSPKSSVTKSRSHGVFPDPAKDTQVPSIEKSHSSPGTAKPSQSEGHGQGQHSRSHAAHTKSTTRHHQDSGRGSTIAAGDALVQSQQQPPQRLQPSHRGRFSLKPQRHSVVGVLTIQRGQSDWLPTQPPAALRRPPDGRLVTLRKAWSEERPQSSGARSAYRSGETPVTAASMDSGLSGSVYSLLDEEAEANEVDSAIFQVPRFGKIPNGTDIVKSSMGHHDGEGKTHAMGEIKIALKKEVRTEGDHLVLEILQCRNITYKFKSPDHLPDLYVKLYVVNIATQKRIIKKKTRVCRHDREPSFNETFRFCMNPTGHALQLFLVSNGGKFAKKTLIGEAYVWLDKVDLRKRVVSWHKLHTSTAQIHS